MQSRDLLFDSVEHVNGTDAVTRYHNAAYGLFRTFDEHARPERIADLHLRHLTYKDGDAVLRTNDDLRHIAQALNEAQVYAEDIFAVDPDCTGAHAYRQLIKEVIAWVTGETALPLH